MPFCLAAIAQRQAVRLGVELLYLCRFELVFCVVDLFVAAKAASANPACSSQRSVGIIPAYRKSHLQLQICIARFRPEYRSG